MLKNAGRFFSNPITAFSNITSPDTRGQGSGQAAPAVDPAAASPSAGPAGIRDSEKARRSGQHFNKMFNNAPWKKKRRGEGEATGEETQGPDAAAASNSRGKSVKERVQKITRRIPGVKNKPQLPEARASASSHRSENEKTSGRKPITTKDIGPPQRIRSNQPDLQTTPEADQRWNRNLELVAQRESLERKMRDYKSSQSIKKTVAGQLASIKHAIRGEPDFPALIRGSKRKNRAEIEQQYRAHKREYAALREEHIDLKVEMLRDKIEKDQAGAQAHGLSLMTKLLALPESGKASMIAAVHRYAPPKVRVNIEDFLHGRVKMVTAETTLFMSIAVEKMVSQLQEAKAFCGIVSNNATYSLLDDLLVRSGHDGKLSFPLPSRQVAMINMSPDQRVHAMCIRDDGRTKELVTLGTDGIAEDSPPLSLPETTYMFAVAKNNTVAIAVRNKDQSSSLMILNGFDRNDGSTEFFPIVIAAGAEQNARHTASSSQEMTTHAEPAVPFPANQQIHSLVFMGTNDLAMLFEDRAHWRLEHIDGLDENGRARYKALPAVPLPKSKRRHIGNKLIKKNGPRRPTPRQDPIPDRLVITPAQVLGAFEADGTPLFLDKRQDWKRLQSTHDMTTPLSNFYDNFARGAIPSAGLSAWGWPASADYFVKLKNAVGRGIGYEFRKIVFPWTLRVEDESLVERALDHFVSHHRLLAPKAFQTFRKQLKEGHRNFFGAIEKRLKNERDFLTAFIARLPNLQRGGHDAEFTQEATRVISEVLRDIVKKLPPKPASEETQKHATDVVQKAAMKIKDSAKTRKDLPPGELAVQTQQLRYKNYHPSEDKVRSPANVLYVVHSALSHVLEEDNELVMQIGELLEQQVFIGFVAEKDRNFFAQTLNTKQDHFNEFSLASSLLASYTSELLAAELKAAEGARRELEPSDANPHSTAGDGTVALISDPLDSMIPLTRSLSELELDAYKAAALQHMRGERSVLTNNHIDAMVSLKKHGILDLSALKAFADACNHFTTAIKQHHHKDRRALEAQGVLGTNDIPKAYREFLANLPVGSSITVTSRRAGGFDLEGMSMFMNLLAKKLVHAGTGATVQVFAIEPVTQLNGGHEYAMTFTKLHNGISVTFGKTKDLTFTPIAFKAQFGIGISQLDSFEKNDVIWAYTGINVKFKDTRNWAFEKSITMTFLDKIESSALNKAVRVLEGDAHPADMLAQADTVSTTTKQALNTVVSLDIEPLFATGVVWDLVTQSFKRQGKALFAYVQQLNFLFKKQEGLTYTANINGETYAFNKSKQIDITNTEIWVSEFQGVPVGNGISIDGRTIPNGNEYFQNKVQPGIWVKTRHIAGTPVTNGGITMQFKPNGDLSGMATSYTYQANFGDQKFQELKEAATRRKAASLEDYIPVLKTLLKNVSDSDRSRLQGIFQKLTKLPRESTITVQLQYIPSVIEEIQDKLPNTKSHIFSTESDEMLGIQELLKIVEKHPEKVQVSQIIINEKRIYKTGSSDGIILLRTQSEANNTLSTFSEITLKYPSKDSLTPASIVMDGTYFTERRVPTKGLLPKLGHIGTYSLLQKDKDVLQFLLAPYDGDDALVEDVRRIHEAMDKLNRSTFQGQLELEAVINSVLTSEERDAIRTLFARRPKSEVSERAVSEVTVPESTAPKISLSELPLSKISLPSLRTQLTSEDEITSVNQADEDELPSAASEVHEDALSPAANEVHEDEPSPATQIPLNLTLISKILATPDYYALFQELNARALAQVDAADIPAQEGSEDQDSDRSIPTPVIVNTDTLPITSLGPVTTGSVAATPVVQNTSIRLGSSTYTKSAGSQSLRQAKQLSQSRSFTRQEGLSAAQLSGTSGASGEPIPSTPVSPVNDLGRLYVGRPTVGSGMQRVSERREPGERYYTVISTKLQGWPVEQNIAFRTMRDAAENLREYVERTTDRSGIIESLRENLVNDPHITDQTFLQIAGVRLERDVMDERESTRDDSIAARLSGRTSTDERRAQLQVQLLAELSSITRETELRDGGVYHHAMSWQLQRLGNTTVDRQVVHQQALNLRHQIVNLLSTSPTRAIDWLDDSADRTRFNLTQLIDAIADPMNIPDEDLFNPSHDEVINRSGAILELIATVLDTTIHLYWEDTHGSTIQPFDAQERTGRDIISIYFNITGNNRNRISIEAYPSPSTLTRRWIMVSDEEPVDRLAIDEGSTRARSRASSVRTRSTEA